MPAKIPMVISVLRIRHPKSAWIVVKHNPKYQVSGIFPEISGKIPDIFLSGKMPEISGKMPADGTEEERVHVLGRPQFRSRA